MKRDGTLKDIFASLVLAWKYVKTFIFRQKERSLLFASVTTETSIEHWCQFLIPWKYYRNNQLIMLDNMSMGSFLYECIISIIIQYIIIVSYVPETTSYKLLHFELALQEEMMSGIKGKNKITIWVKKCFDGSKQSFWSVFLPSSLTSRISKILLALESAVSFKTQISVLYEYSLKILPKFQVIYVFLWYGNKL